MGAQGPQLVRVALHQDAERHLKVASDDAVAGGSHQDLTAFPLRQRPDVPVHLGHLRQWGNKDQRLFGVGIQRVAESGIPRPRSPFSGRKDPTGPVGRPCHRQRRSFRPWGPGARRRVPRGRCAGFSTPTSILKRQPGNRKTGWEERPMGRDSSVMDTSRPDGNGSVRVSGQDVAVVGKGQTRDVFGFIPLLQGAHFPGYGPVLEGPETDVPFPARHEGVAIHRVELDGHHQLRRTLDKIKSLFKSSCKDFFPSGSLLHEDLLTGGGGPLDATLRGFSEKDQWLRDWFFSLADIHLGFGYFRSFVAFLPIPQRQVVMHRIVDGHQESPTILQHSNMIDALESDPCQFDPAEETSAGIPEFRIRPAGSSQDQLKHIFVFFQKSISRIFFVNSGSSSTSWLKCRDSFVFFSLSFSFLPVFKFPFESIKWIRCIKLIPDVQPSVAARKQQQHQQQHQQQQQKQPELIQSCTLVTNQQWAQTLSHSSGILTNSFISNLLRGGEGEGWKGGKEELTFQEFQFVVVVSKKKCI